MYADLKLKKTFVLLAYIKLFQRCKGYASTGSKSTVYLVGSQSVLPNNEVMLKYSIIMSMIMDECIWVFWKMI